MHKNWNPYGKNRPSLRCSWVRVEKFGGYCNRCRAYPLEEIPAPASGVKGMGGVSSAMWKVCRFFSERTGALLRRQRLTK